MAAEQSPDSAIMLLDLYKEHVGMPENIYDYVKGLLGTAFQEGILCEMQKQTLNITHSNYGITIQHHRRAEEN
jgi:DNA gyrase inhibitor GyrI